MTQEDKKTILDQLSVTINKVAFCQTLAEENNLTDQAGKFGQLKNQLKETYDKLAAEAFQNWIAEAVIVQKELETSQSELRKIIQDIEQQQAILENVVAAIGKIEELVVKVRAILPMI